MCLKLNGKKGRSNANLTQRIVFQTTLLDFFAQMLHRFNAQIFRRKILCNICVLNLCNICAKIVQ